MHMSMHWENKNCCVLQLTGVQIVTFEAHCLPVSIKYGKASELTITVIGVKLVWSGSTSI